MSKRTKNHLWTDTLREIRNTRSRFISLLVLSALAVCFLAGLRATAPDMKNSADRYLDGQKLMDLRITGTLGLTEGDAEALALQPGVAALERACTVDAILHRPDNDYILKVHSFTADPGLNAPALVAGRMPERPTECLAEPLLLELTGLSIGDTISLDTGTGDYEGALPSPGYTIVGTANSPLYVGVERGSSSLGTGKVSAFLLLPLESFHMETYTDFYLQVEGMAGLLCYSDSYTDTMEDFQDKLEPFADHRAALRGEEVLTEANEKLAEAEQELNDAEAEALEEIADGERELADARIELDDGWAEYYDGLAELESEVADAEAEIADGEEELADALRELQDAEAELADGRKELNQGWQDYREGLQEYQEGLADYEDGKAQYEEGLADYQEGLAQYQKGEIELDEGRFAYRDGLRQYKAALAELEAGMAQLEEQEGAFDQGLTALRALLPYPDNPSLLAALADPQQSPAIDGALEQARGQLEDGILMLEAQLAATDPADPMYPALQGQLTQLKTQREGLYLNGQPITAQLLLYAKAQMDGARTQLEAGQAQLSGVADQLSDARRKLRKGEQELEEAKVELEDGWRALEEARVELEDGWEELEDGRVELEDALVELTDGEQELWDGEVELADGWAEYYDGLTELADARQTLADEVAEAQAELADGLRELQDGEREYADGLLELEDGKAEAAEKIADARKELEQARRDIEALDESQWYLLGRNTNTGYMSYSMDADRMGNLASVFPLIFFLVAALVCLTTMTRMVEEQRTTIGGLKALGYSRWQIAVKYVGYGFLASFAGSLLGLALGLTLIPWIICNAWNIIYQVGPTYYSLEPLTSLSACGAAVGTVTLSALVACFSALSAVPAQLMRPKAPPIGKRVLLERLPFLWSRLSFNYKITLRNLFRYQKRFWMTVIGIGGCAALIITAFGLRDSIFDVMDKQYDELYTYTSQIGLVEHVTPGELAEVTGALDAAPLEVGWLTCRSEMVTGETAKYTVDATLQIFDSQQAAAPFIDLRHRTDSVPVTLPDSGVVLTEKLAKLLGVGPGDTFTLDGEGRVEVQVADITEHYIQHYIYMTDAYYEALFGEDCEDNLVLASYAIDHPGTAALETSLVGLDGVTALSRITDTRQTFTSSLASVNYAVILIIVCAAALAFVVLYNLTNINITERLRELATLKVLGFYDGELSAYVYRENVILTIFGVAMGTVMGKLLHQWLILTVEIDLLMFGRVLSFTSYAYAAVLTTIFSLAVNLAAHKKLKKLDMVESLKTVE